MYVRQKLKITSENSDIGARLDPKLTEKDNIIEKRESPFEEIKVKDHNPIEIQDAKIEIKSTNDVVKVEKIENKAEFVNQNLEELLINKKEPIHEETKIDDGHTIIVNNSDNEIKYTQAKDVDIHEGDASISNSYVKVENVISSDSVINNQPIIIEENNIKMVNEYIGNKAEQNPISNENIQPIIQPNIENENIIIPNESQTLTQSIEIKTQESPKSNILEETKIIDPITLQDNQNNERLTSEQDEIQKSILLQNLKSTNIPETNIEDQPDDILERPSESFIKHINPKNIGYAAVTIAGLVISYLLYKKYSK